MNGTDQATLAAFSYTDDDGTTRAPFSTPDFNSNYAALKDYVSQVSPVAGTVPASPSTSSHGAQHSVWHDLRHLIEHVVHDAGKEFTFTFTKVEDGIELSVKFVFDEVSVREEYGP
jgi:hypothetical protein